MAGIGFCGIGDLIASNGIMGSTTFRTFPDLYLFPYIGAIFDEHKKRLFDNNALTNRGRPVI